MGAFDDLIPDSGNANPFADLIPKKPQVKASDAADQMQPDYHKALQLLFGQNSVMDDLEGVPVPAPAPNAISTSPDPQSVASALPSAPQQVGIVEKGVRGAIGSLGKSGAGIIQAGAEALDLNTLADIAAAAGRRANAFGENVVLDKTPIAGFTPNSIVQDLPVATAGAISSIGTNLPALAANVVLPGSGLPIMGVQSAAGEYSDARAAGMTPIASAVRAIPMGAAEVVGEKVGGFDTVTRGIRRTIDEGSIVPLARAMVSSGLRENPGEQLTTALQFGIDKLPGVGMNQEATLQDYLKAVKDTALTTMLQSGGMVGGGMALQNAKLPQTKNQQIASAINEAVNNSDYAMPADEVARSRLNPDNAQVNIFEDLIPKQSVQKPVQTAQPEEKPEAGIPASTDIGIPITPGIKQETPQEQPAQQPAQAQKPATESPLFTQLRDMGGVNAQQLETDLGYTKEQIASLPEGVAKENGVAIKDVPVEDFADTFDAELRKVMYPVKGDVQPAPVAEQKAPDVQEPVQKKRFAEMDEINLPLKTEDVAKRFIRQHKLWKTHQVDWRDTDNGREYFVSSKKTLEEYEKAMRQESAPLTPDTHNTISEFLNEHRDITPDDEQAIRSMAAETGNDTAGATQGSDGTAAEDGRVTPQEDRPTERARDAAESAKKLTGNPIIDNPASWVIKEKATGKVIMETFDRKKVDALNTEKYEAVSIYDHLSDFNKKAKEADRERKPENNGIAASKGVNRKSTAEQVRQAIAADPVNSIIEVYQSIDDIADADVRSRIKKSGADDIEGYYDAKNNRVAIIADNITPERAVEVARHEVIGHYGMEGMLGKAEMKRVADRVIKAEQEGNKVIIDLGKQVDRLQPDISPQRRAEEIIALMAEKNMQNSITKRVLDAIRKFLHKLGAIRSDVTDADIAKMLRDARAYLEEKGAKKSEQSEQIKPDLELALSRQGAFDLSTFDVNDPKVADNIIRAMQNKQIDLKRVQDAITENGREINESADAYLNEELYIGRVTAMLDKLSEKRVTPILQAVIDSGKTLQEVDDYLYARHVVLDKVNARLKELNKDLPNNDALSGLTDKEANDIYSQRTPELDKIGEMVDRLTKETRRRIVTGGLETEATVAEWENTYQHYVPLMRDADGQPTRGASGYAVRGKETQRRMGSEKRASNILANIIAQAQGTITRVEKARVGRSLLDLARQHPNDDFWKVDTPPQKKRVNPETGLAEYANDPRYKAADHVLVVKENGREHFIVFNEKNERAMAVAKAMKNMDAAKLPWAVDAVGKLTRSLAMWITSRNPLFWITNFARDVQHAVYNLSDTPISGKEAQVLKNIPGAMKGYWQISRGEGTGEWADIANEFKSAGGETGFVKVFDSISEHTKELEKQLKEMEQGKADPRKLARSLVEMIDDYNMIVENGVRLAVYKAARDNGVSIKKAASIAKNITVNFNRRGNQSNFTNALYMFMNANIQGHARFFTAVAKSNKARGIAAGMVAFGFIMDIVNRAIGGDDDKTGRKKYDLIPDWEKEKNWIFMAPGGQYIKIPMPQGLHVMPNIGRMIAEGIFSSKKQDAVEKALSMTRIFFDAFNPFGSTGSFSQFIAPSVVKPIVSVTENKSFMGSPLYRAGDDRNYVAPAYQRHFRSTADHWVNASKFLNDITGGDEVKPGKADVPPEVLRTLFLSYVAPGITQTADKAVDTSTKVANGQKVEPSQIPAASRFYGEAPEERSQERAYYEEVRKIQQKIEQAKQYAKKGQRDKVEQAFSELGDGDAQEGRKVMARFESSEKQLISLNKVRKQIEKNDKLAEERKQALLERNDTLRKEAMARVMRGG